jgi:hypothetical protein
MKNSNLTVLLNDSNESLYWTGFILADGHIDTDVMRLRVSLSTKDTPHLLKLAEYIKTKVNVDEKCCTLGCQDKMLIEEYSKKYNITNRKTYQPPKFNEYELTDTQWISLICGYIDGDGCIGLQTGRKAHTIRIKCHSSWYENLKFIEEKLFKVILDEVPNNHTKIDKQGYALLGITRNILITKLKEKALSLNIPLMLRKWDKIDLNYVSKYENSKNIKTQSIQLYKSGLSINDISKKLGYSYGGVYRIVRHI